MIWKQIKRMSGVQALSAGLATALIAGLLVVFTGQANAAKGTTHDKAAAGCVATLMGANTVDKALSELVTEGTLTQAQADAVKAKIGETSTKGEKACAGLALLKEAGVGDALQKLLGMDVKQIHAEFASGKSLAEIAQSKNVDRQTLVSAITTALNGELDKLVTGGKLSATQAASLKTDIAAKVEKAVDVHKTTAKPGIATPVATPTT